MNAIIRLGNKEYYLSPIFAYYSNIQDDKHGYNAYYIVLNKEKTKLIKKELFTKNGKYLDRQVLVLDDDKTSWQIDKNGYGNLKILKKEELLNYIKNDNLPKEVLNECLKLDRKIKYKEYNEINTKKDIDIFMNVSANLHDAIISEIKQENDSLTILFTGIWGCNIEIIFKDDITYSTYSKDIEKNNDPIWYDSNIIFDGQYKVLIDNYDVKLKDINNDYCWFKAKKIIYRVIPK